MSEDQKNKINQLLKETKQFGETFNKSNDSIENTKIKSKLNTNFISKLLASIYKNYKSISNLIEVLKGVNEKIFSPIMFIIGPPLRRIWKIYASIWNKYAYTIDSDTKYKTISKTKSALLLTLFILFTSIFTPTSLGDSVRFFTTEPLIDSLGMLFTKKSEIFYLSYSEEIDPENNIHAVRGCKTRGICSDKESVYFRVKPRLSHDIWKLIKYGNPIYVPDHVVAPIAPGVNECLVIYYGYRITSSWISRLLRSLEFYPILLEANCTYVGAENQN